MDLLRSASRNWSSLPGRILPASVQPKMSIFPCMARSPGACSGQAGEDRANRRPIFHRRGKSEQLFIDTVFPKTLMAEDSGAPKGHAMAKQRTRNDGLVRETR